MVIYETWMADRSRSDFKINLDFGLFRKAGSGFCNQYLTVPVCPVVNAVQELFFNTTPGNPLDPDLSICRYMLVADVRHVVCVVVPVRDGRS